VSPFLQGLKYKHHFGIFLATTQTLNMLCETNNNVSIKTNHQTKQSKKTIKHTRQIICMCPGGHGITQRRHEVQFATGMTKHQQMHTITVWVAQNTRRTVGVDVGDGGEGTFEAAVVVHEVDQHQFLLCV
jgi:hypothetical protein